MQFFKLAPRFFVVALLCGVVSSCAYVIPPEPNAARNNEVDGSAHRPQLNNANTNRQSAITPRNLPMSVPMVQVDNANFPPVDAVTQTRADAVMGAADNGRSAERRIPVENMQFQVSANNYPPIESVPPRPITTGPDSAKARLSATQADLEKQRDVAIESKDTLAKDAAAEPSILSELPKAEIVTTVKPVVPAMIEPTVVVPQQFISVPQTKAIRSAPAVKMPDASIAPAIAPQRVARAVSAVATVSVPAAPAPSVSVATLLPANPSFAPPAPLVMTEPTPAVIVSAPVVLKPAVTTIVHAAPSAALAVANPVDTGSIPQPLVVQRAQPITLAAQPIIVTPLPPAGAPGAATVPHVKKGDFDPLAVADNVPIAALANNAVRNVASSTYNSDHYIAPSRYADRRQ